ncbi:tetratricopeptide repeat protein [Pseudofulvibacter geojedonensis]|uniref:Cell surface protein n=1 Tax=Pseudofulvibacter geojedonensis TaxID=1123758 RepID=A0ABW3I0D8_9FLAO
MKTSYITIFSIISLFTITSCVKETNSLSNKNDYLAYLTPSNSNNSYNEELLFWNKKLDKHPDQFPYLLKIAHAENALFESTGKIEHLINAESKLTDINKKTNYNNANYLRALAKNYISQHKFKKALKILKKAELNGEKLTATHKMLFDVYLELGHKTEAEEYLSKFKNFEDFDYLIRLAKWSDHEGDLDNAIQKLEMALVKAKKSNNNHLQQWSYTNLADFYGHANDIEKSYQYYLKALKLNPNNAYAKKGIAWILYSHENNPKEALNILNSITKNYTSPDYFLLKAEIYEFLNNSELKKENIDTYLELSKNPKYGNMYNKYNALLNIEEFNNFNDALETVKAEINLRPTPQSYGLLAWLHYHKGNHKEALNIANEHVIGKTFEPETLYQVAVILKANDFTDKTFKIKKDLMESKYELGPLMAKKVERL